MQTPLTNKQVLITGAAGFLGSHLAIAALEQGAKVVGVDNYISGRKSNVSAITETPQARDSFIFIEADVSTHPASYLPAEIQFDLILHFASPASPPIYQKHPIETYLVNSWGTHQLLDHCHKTYPEARFLFASTSEVYGDPLEHPQTETYWGNVNPNGVRSCYDESKRLGETIAGVYFREFGMDTRIVRIFNTYGPRINPADGRVVPDFIATALKGEKLQIFGDGSQTRSFCYVSDLISGIMAFAKSENLGGETINIGNPDEKSVLELARIVYHETQLAQKYPSFEAAIAHFDLPKDDPNRRKPDISKAKNILNWSPSVDITQGIKETVAYFRQHEVG